MKFSVLIEAGGKKETQKTIEACSLEEVRDLLSDKVYYVKDIKDKEGEKIHWRMDYTYPEPGINFYKLDKRID